MDERVSISRPSNAQFEACYKHGDVNLPLFQPLPEYLRGLLESPTSSAKQFRKLLRLYNAALAFILVNYIVANYSVGLGSLNCF